MSADPFAAGSLVWPLCILLVILCILRKIEHDVRPILMAVTNGVAKSAASNAPAYAIAILFGLSASLSAFVDVFKELDRASLLAMSWHQYLSLWAKVLNPFIVAVLAYATQNKFKGAPSSGVTNPPFTPNGSS